MNGLKSTSPCPLALQLWTASLLALAAENIKRNKHINTLENKKRPSSEDMTSQFLLFFRKHFFSPHHPSNCFSIPTAVITWGPFFFPEATICLSLFATYIFGVSGMPGTQLTGMAVYVGAMSSASYGYWRPAVMEHYTDPLSHHHYYHLHPDSTVLKKIQKPNPRQQGLLKYLCLLGNVHFIKREMWWW